MDSQNKPFSSESLSERLFNTITHGIGSILSIVALVLMVVYASYNSDAWSIVGVSIFGSTLILLYMSSTLYHAFSNGRVKQIFKTLDQSFIYLLIAGTYTPICLINLYGPWGWSMFGVIWGLCLIGIFLKIMDITPFKNYENYLYLTMGWLALIGIYPIIIHFTKMPIILLFLGGILFTVGILFYIWDNKKYFHAIWHLFVIGGSVCHYLLIILYVIPYVIPTTDKLL